jgi:mannose-6-phosphate isomerase-like protein (cupin superfamily)
VSGDSEISVSARDSSLLVARLGLLDRFTIDKFLPDRTPLNLGSTVAERRHRIAPVPFTLRNIKEDLEDIGARFDGAPDLEFRAATKALELEKAALSYQRVPPGYRFPYGHTHETQEEVYVVLRGSGRMKLDDALVELREWDAVRVPPRTWRGYEAGPEGLEILVIGAPNLGENPREDVDGRRDWWADEPPA